MCIYIYIYIYNIRNNYIYVTILKLYTIIKRTEFFILNSTKIVSWN
jgi:hypothetical protein